MNKIKFSIWLIAIFINNISSAQSVQSFCFMASTQLSGYKLIAACESTDTSARTYDLRLWKRGAKYVVSRVQTTGKTEKCLISKRSVVYQYQDLYSVDAKFLGGNVYLYTDLRMGEDSQAVLSVSGRIFNASCVKF